MDPDATAALVRDVGFPIVAAFAAFFALWSVGKFALGSIMRKLVELERAILEQRVIIVKLIDRVRSLETLEVQTHTMMRTLSGLGVDVSQIGAKVESQLDKPED